MLDTQILIEIMGEEKNLVSRFIEANLKEREGIVNSDTTLLAESLKDKEEVKAALNMLEKKRVQLTGERSLREIIQEVEQEAQSKLASLQSDLKISVREAQALSKANIVLFKQSLAIQEQLQREIFGAKGQSYNGSGELAGRTSAGNYVSSSA